MNNWQPTASLDAIKARALLLKKIRGFFEAQGVLEVETPALGQYGVSDIYLDNFKTTYLDKQSYYLQTSPEYHMKRLLAAGSGSIYQIGKCFRHESSSKHHNPEFTMLEWYRIGYDYFALMEEVSLLLKSTLAICEVEKITYSELFKTHLAIDPIAADIDELSAKAKEMHIDCASVLTTKDEWLFLLLSHCIEPNLGLNKPLIIYDFPASQAALAQINSDKKTAKRFEVYFQGIELANGFQELTDYQEQLARFEIDNQQRKSLGLASVALDQRFLAALASKNMPACSGVALGVDRLLMLRLGLTHIQQVLAFPISIS